MGRFWFPSFFLLWLFAGLLFFPPALTAQHRPGRPRPGDRVEETEGEGLIIRSNPSGAWVYIDGIQRGRTPLRLQNFRFGTYSVQLEKEGFVDYWVTVSSRPGSVTRVYAELQPAIGRVFLNIRPAPDSSGTLTPLAPLISVDGQSYSSASLELPVGFRSILVRAFGWEDFSTTLYVELNSFRELELNMKPASFKFYNTGISRGRFNPGNAGSLGTTTYSFEVSAPGRGTLTVMNGEWKPVFVRALGPFEGRSQSVVWDGRDGQGEILPDGVYTMVVEVSSIPADDTPPVQDGYVLNVEIDSGYIISPLALGSGKSGLLYAPLPELLPRGSFQIEGSLLAGSPAELSSESGGPWTSLPFAVALRVSALEQLELSAALNVLPHVEKDPGAGIGAGAKWVFHNSKGGGLPLDAAAGAIFSWTGKTGLTPFGMASGIELYFPLKLDLGNLFSLALAPAALWTGDEGFPWGPVPRLLVSGGLLMRMAYVSAGLSLRSEYNFTGGDPWPPFIIAGGEVKIFPPPSNFVFSFMGGVWVRGSDLGGFGGLGIGMIY